MQIIRLWITSCEFTDCIRFLENEIKFFVRNIAKRLSANEFKILSSSKFNVQKIINYMANRSSKNELSSV